MQKSKGRILCVDDDKDTCEMVSALFGLEGYEVYKAESVAEGLALAVADNFDLILLDWIFEDGTGLDLCKVIRKSGTPAPILFYSGMAHKSDIGEAMSAGAQGFLVKPTNVEDLLLAVKRAIGNDSQTSPPT